MAADGGLRRFTLTSRHSIYWLVVGLRYRYDQHSLVNPLLLLLHIAVVHVRKEASAGIVCSDVQHTQGCNWRVQARPGRCLPAGAAECGPLGAMSSPAGEQLW